MNRWPFDFENDGMGGGDAGLEQVNVGRGPAADQQHPLFQRHGVLCPGDFQFGRHGLPAATTTQIVFPGAGRVLEVNVPILIRSSSIRSASRVPRR